MAVRIHPIAVRGVFTTFCYFIVDESSGHGVLVDAGAQPGLLARAAEENGWRIDAILLTHGHFDHFGAAGQLSRQWGASIWAHRESRRYLESPELNLSGRYGPGIALGGVGAFDDGDTIPVAEGVRAALRVIHLPGHTRDSVAFHCEDLGVAFVGDTIYEGGPGLTVFPTGDTQALAGSIARIKAELPSGTLLLSGHSQPIAVDDL